MFQKEILFRHFKEFLKRLLIAQKDQRSTHNCQTFVLFCLGISKTEYEMIFPEDFDKFATDINESTRLVGVSDKYDPNLAAKSDIVVFESRSSRYPNSLFSPFHYVCIDPQDCKYLYHRPQFSKKVEKAAMEDVINEFQRQSHNNSVIRILYKRRI